MRYGIVGALACALATLVAEIFVQVMDPSAAADDALAVALLIDTSGSMTGLPIQEVQSASIRFLRTWDRSQTHLAVIPFSDSARLLRPILQPGQEAQRVTAQIEEFAATGSTSMADGLRKAQQALNEMAAPRKAIMLFTDGEPNNTVPTLLRAEAMRRAGTVIVRRHGVRGSRIPDPVGRQ